MLRDYFIARFYELNSCIFYVYYSLLSRNFTFFTLINPSMHQGGMLDESKIDLYDIINHKNVPKYFLSSEIGNKKIKFPVISKPVVGYAGLGVSFISNQEELNELLSEHKGKKLIIQEYIETKEEYSIFFKRIPGEKRGFINSVVRRVPSQIIGDGKSTISELINKNFKNWRLRKKLLSENRTRLLEVLDNNEVDVLTKVQNVNRGVGIELLPSSIKNEIEEPINELMEKVDGVNFSRIDIKANSIEDIAKGKYYILELNGAKSEPLEIFDTKIGFFRKISIIQKHWSWIYKIAKLEKERGAVNGKLSDSIKSFRNLKNLTKG